jgi:hypothetical protein
MERNILLKLSPLSSAIQSKRFVEKITKKKKKKKKHGETQHGKNMEKPESARPIKRSGEVLCSYAST